MDADDTNAVNDDLTILINAHYLALKSGKKMDVVAQIHVIGPNWNEVRQTQVIGRASRNESVAHQSPPKITLQTHQSLQTPTP
jgi:hypothetical protein